MVVITISEIIIGNRIGEIRRIKKVTQQELANGIGMQRTSLSQIENGIYAPSTETMMKISDFFDLPIGEIFFNPSVLNHNTRREVV